MDTAIDREQKASLIRGVAGRSRWNRAAPACRGSRIRITAQLPDGRWQPLPDTPLLLGRALRLADPKPARLARWRQEVLAGRARAACFVDARRTDRRPHSRVRRSGRRRWLASIAVLATIGGACAGHRDRRRDARRWARRRRSTNWLPPAGLRCCVIDQNLGFVGSVNRALAMRIHP